MLEVVGWAASTVPCTRHVAYQPAGRRHVRTIGTAWNNTPHLRPRSILSHVPASERVAQQAPCRSAWHQGNEQMGIGGGWSFTL
jgi:hypothetical protein